MATGRITADKSLTPVAPKLLTVSGVAQLFGISAQAVRRLEESGVVSPSERTAGQHRRYTIDDVQKLRKYLSERRKTCTVISLVNQKGGVGKTTVSINLGGALAQMGYRVLIVDFDPQANATFGLGVSWDLITSSIADVIGHEQGGPTKTMAEIIMPLDINPNLFLAPSHLDLAYAETTIQNKIGRDKRLDKALQKVRSEFDYILIDSPPSLGLLSINAIMASDAIIVPIDGAFALEGVRQLFTTRNECTEDSEHDIYVLGGLLNKQRLGTGASSVILEKAQASFGDRVFKTILPERTSVDVSTILQQPIVFTNASEAKLYFTLAEEVTQHVAELTNAS